MSLADFLRAVVQRLKKNDVQFALAGGLACSVYRSQIRATDDLDFLLLSNKDTEALAREILTDFGLSAGIARKADLEGGPIFAVKRRRSVPCIVIGRPQRGKTGIGLDFILPGMPWFKLALNRAMHNNIDFGFGTIPTITVEDVIISKFYALENDASRFNDLDDLKSIFENEQEIDLAYVAGRMKELKLSLPVAIKGFVPVVLRRVSKEVLRDIRKR